MTVSKARGAKAKADKLFSQLIRSRGRCEFCGERDYSKLQTAHIVSRRYSNTRVDPANAFCLCWKCHFQFTHNPFDWVDFVVSRIGREKYDAIYAKAQAGVGTKVRWEDEVARLQALLPKEVA